MNTSPAVPARPTTSDSIASTHQQVGSIEDLTTALEPLRQELVAHRIYSAIVDMTSLQLFAQSHIFAVWDFMSLLKSLQRSITCVEVPWTPPQDPETARLINEIVLGEETDEASCGPISHFDLYRKAMDELGASTDTIDAFVQLVRSGTTIEEALRSAGAPDAAAEFVTATFKIVSSGSTPAIAAAFAFGREDVIPDMFVRLIGTLDSDHPGAFDGLREYLVRHIELDGDEHGPAAENMIALLCGSDPTCWAQAHSGAVAALQARLALWDGLLVQVESDEATIVLQANNDRRVGAASQH